MDRYDGPMRRREGERKREDGREREREGESYVVRLESLFQVLTA